MRTHHSSLLLGFSSVASVLHYCIGQAHPLSKLSVLVSLQTNCLQPFLLLVHFTFWSYQSFWRIFDPGLFCLYGKSSADKYQIVSVSWQNSYFTRMRIRFAWFLPIRNLRNLLNWPQRCTAIRIIYLFLKDLYLVIMILCVVDFVLITTYIK